MKSPLAESKKDSGKKKHPKHKSRITIGMADSGGFRADHEPYTDHEGNPVEAAQHNLPDMDSLNQHVADHFGPPDGDADDAGAGGPPPQE